jgi:hypothetical protein
LDKNNYSSNFWDADISEDSVPKIESRILLKHLEVKTKITKIYSHPATQNSIFLNYLIQALLTLRQL